LRVALVELVLATLLVNTARYWFPLSPEAAVKLKVVFVAPEISFQLVPPLVLTCHWTVGVGLPVAAAVKLAVAPELTVELLGF
jgi:hypothetical protein